MYSRKLYYLVMFVVFGVIINSCKDTSTNFIPDDNPVVSESSFGNATFGASTIQIPEEVLNMLVSVSEDGTQFVFSETSPALETLQAGSIMLMGISEKTPMGALRKVTRIERSGDVSQSGQIQSQQIVIYTTETSIEEAFENLELSSGEIQLNPGDVDSIVFKVPSFGIHQKMTHSTHPEILTNAFSIPFEQIFAQGTDPANVIKLSGNMEMSTSFNFDILVRAFRLKAIELYQEIDLESSVTFTATYNTVDIEDEIIIFAYWFVPFAIGPVVITPRFDIIIGYDGELNVTFVAETGMNFDAKAGIRYDSGDWSPIAEFEPEFIRPEYEFEANARIKGYITPAFNFLLYGVTGPYAAVQGYVEASADINRSPLLQLVGGINANAGVIMDIISLITVSRELTVYEWNSVFYQSVDPDPIVETFEAINITHNSVVLRGRIQLDGSGTVTERGFCYGTDTNPDLVNGTCFASGSGTGDYSLQATGLARNTAYYYRSYGVSAGQYFYSENRGFTTLAEPPDGIGTLSGQVKDAVTDQSVSEVSVRVENEAGIVVGRVTTDNTGLYILDTQEGNSYTVYYTKSGYIPAVYRNVNILAGQTTFLSQVLYIDDRYSGPGSASGVIRNAMTGQLVSGLVLQLRSGINTNAGTIIAQTNTSGSGYYSFTNIPAGHYTVTASGTGYTTMSFDVVVVGGQSRGNQNASITPILDDSEVRIVLTWGSSPGDLDSHLTGPTPTNNRFHVYYRQREYIFDGQVMVKLDQDVVSSFGPETITILNQTPGVYRYSVYDFSNGGSTISSALSNSGAKVQVYQGGDLAATFNVPSSRPGTLWTVFEMSNGIIEPVNSMTYTSGSSSIQSELNDDSFLINEIKKGHKTPRF